MYQTRLYHKSLLESAVNTLHEMYPGNQVRIITVPIWKSHEVKTMYRAEVESEILVTLIEAYAKLIAERRSMLK